MDYKEFIKSLHDEAMFQRSRFGRGVIATELKSAAVVIETLLAERDAAVEDLRMRTCQVCKHKDVDTFSPPCCFCYKKRNFEWRGPQSGPQKGDGHGT